MIVSVLGNASDVRDNYFIGPENRRSGAVSKPAIFRI